MPILQKHKLNIHKGYLYLTALLFSCVVVLQVISANAVTTFLGALRYVVLFVTSYFVWVFLIEYIHGTLQLLQNQQRRLSQRILKFSMSVLLLLTFHLIITNIIYYGYLITATQMTFDDVWSDFQPFLLKSFFSRALDLGVILVLLKIIEGYWTLQKQRLQVVSLENQLHLSQLEALRAQLDPHFLFNTLHTLHSLIGYDDKKAKSMLIKVTNLMRKTLDQRGKHLISLEEELEYIQDYLDIEQERFYDRLKIVLDITDEAKQIEVPALILQPLVENAFKHGISLMETAGEIHVSGELDYNNLILEIKNSIPSDTKSSEVPSNQFGLNNLKKRLDQTYGTLYEFSARKEGTFFIVHIIIKDPKEV